MGNCNEQFELKPGEFFEKMEEGWFLHSPKPNIKKLYIEPTNRCNLNCITCVRNSWPGDMGDMKLSLFEKIFSQLKNLPELDEAILGGLGEPLIHPQITHMVKKLKDLGLKVRITTNAMLLDESLARELVRLRVDELMVSCDGITEDKFSEIRHKGDLREVIENTKRLNEIKISEGTIFPKIGIEFVMMEKNKTQVKKLPELARKLDALSVLVTNLLPYTEEMTEEILYHGRDDEKVFAPSLWTNPLKEFGTVGTVSFPRMRWGAYRRCNFVDNKSAVISWDGRLAPCYPLVHSNRYYIFGREKQVTAYTLGDLNENPIEDIWCSKEYSKFRNKVRKFRFPSCVDCDLNTTCDYARENEDCWGNSPSCADCLWAQDIIRCP